MYTNELQYSMRRISREDYIESDRSSKVSKPSKYDIAEIDKILHQMQSTYRANIQAQQRYIDILKRKNKNINSNYIKSIYALFSENKANQICYEKEEENFLNFQYDEKIIRRYYARMIEMGIRKISYFWMNTPYLEFLSSYIVKYIRIIHTCFNQIHKQKTLDMHFTALKMLFNENALIQQKIYELLIDEGYLLSMDEFYRINGVDLVADRLYQRKSNNLQSPDPDESQQQSIKKQNEPKIQTPKNRIQKQKQKKVWGYSKNSPEPFTISPTQVQRNKTKIKNMIESIVTVLKSSIEPEKQNVVHLQVIQQQNYGAPKSQRDEIESTKQLPVIQTKTKKRISKPQNIISPQFRRRVNEKKMSIQLMSYFSNQFKSVISQTQQVDINFLSQLLMTSESNTKSIPTACIKINNNDPSYIHSLKSLQSLKRIRDQKKRGKLMEMALKHKNIESMSQMYEQINDTNPFQFKTNSLKQKFSFRSAPGVYITLPKKQESKLKPSLKSSKKSQTNNNRFVIRQNFPKDHIFQNELIVNQLASRQQAGSQNKVNYADINGDSLLRGVLSKNLYALYFIKQAQGKSAITDRQVPKSMMINLASNNNQLQQRVIKSSANNNLIKNGGENFHQKRKNEKESQRTKKNKQNVEEKVSRSIQFETKVENERSGRCITVQSQHKKTKNGFNYTIYDRLRRKIIICR